MNTNKSIRDAIYLECLDAVELSPEGQELQATRKALTEQIREALGLDVTNTFEDLMGESIILYAERMFDYGLTIGRHPESVFSLPDSKNMR